MGEWVNFRVFPNVLEGGEWVNFRVFPNVLEGFGHMWTTIRCYSMRCT